MLISGFFDGLYIGQDENGAIYDRMYQAEFFSKYFSSFISNGIFNKNPNSFKLFVVDNNTIGVNTGSCFINGYFGFSNDITTLQITPNNNANNRIDRVVLRLDLSLRDIKIELLQGDPNADPTPNDFIRYGDIYDLVIGDILINNTGTITDEDITDKRDNTLLCGYVNHNFNMIDNTSMYYNVLKFIRHSKIAEKKEFNKWFNNIKNVLNSNTVSKHIINTPFATDGVHGFKYNINKNIFEKFEDGEYKEIKIGKNVTLDKTPKINITSTDKEIKISWVDAKDIIINDDNIIKWIGTILVKKIGSPPLSYDDGEILIDNKERDKYKDNPYIDTNVNEDIEYYYGLFPYDKNGNYNTSINNIKNAHLNLLSKKTYSFIIDLDESNPDNNITYTDDSEEYTTPESWDNSPLFKSIRPCVLKDGQVNYYLNPDNYDLKDDGTQSDLTGADGDVMVEFPTLFYKMEDLGNKKLKFSISADYEDLVNNDDWEKIYLDYDYNNISRRIYISAYLCSIENNNIISKQTNNNINNIPKHTVKDICNKLLNKNNTSFIMHHAFIQVLLLLGFLRFKTTSLQKILNLNKNNTNYIIGSLTTGGLFSGCNSDTPQDAVKFLGLELTISKNIILGAIEQVYKVIVTDYLKAIHNYSLYTSYNKYFRDTINNDLYLNDLYEENNKFITYLLLGSAETAFTAKVNLTPNTYYKLPNTFGQIKNIGILLQYNEALNIEPTYNTYLTLRNDICPDIVQGASNKTEKYFITFDLDILNYWLFILSGYKQPNTTYTFYYMYLPPNED